MDHLDRGNLDLLSVRHVVLDEADEMLDMGFGKDIEQILSGVDMAKSQTLLFSATTPDWIVSISRQYLKNPVKLDSSSDGEARTATTVSHRALLVPTDLNLRSTLLEDVVTIELARPNSKAIVFTQVSELPFHPYPRI